MEANISWLINLRSLCEGDDIGSWQLWSFVAICIQYLDTAACR